MKKWYLLSALCLPIGFQPLLAQKASGMMHRLWSTDSSGLSAIAMYPAEVREAILIAATRPEVLVRMDVLREESSEEFMQIASDYDRELQEQIYELTRYPGLIAALADGQRLHGQALTDFAAGYPEEVREEIVAVSEGAYEALVEIRLLDLRIDEANQKILTPYPAEVRTAYAELVQYPEVVVILAENLDMTVLIGDAYRNDRKTITAQLDSLSLELARQNAENLEAWKQEMEEDPEAMEDFQRAAEDYAEESGYTREEYTRTRTEVVIVDHYSYGYRYWYGYPWWYTRPVWYPHPWWYDWGYYYGPGGSIVFIGLPSWHFCHWYYHHPWHHYHYPHFSNFTVNYYYGHRNSPGSLAMGVKKLERDTRPYFKPGWTQNPDNRKDLIKSYGQIELNYQEAAVKNPKNFTTKDNYIRQEIQKNPKIRSYAVEQPKTETVARPKPGYVVPEYKNTIPKHKPVAKPSYTRPKVQIKQPRTNSYQQINKAKDFHKSNWSKPKTVAPVRRTPRSNTGGKSGVKRR